MKTDLLKGRRSHRFFTNGAVVSNSVSHVCFITSVNEVIFIPVRLFLRLYIVVRLRKMFSSDIHETL